MEALCCIIRKLEAKTIVNAERYIFMCVNICCGPQILFNDAAVTWKCSIKLFLSCSDEKFLIVILLSDTFMLFQIQV